MTSKNYRDTSGVTDAQNALQSIESDETDLLAQLPLTSVLEAMPDAVGVYHHSGRLIFANSAAHKLFDTGADPHALDRSLYDRLGRLKLRDTTGAPLPPERWHVTRLLGGETITGDHPFEMIMTRADGEECYISVTGAPITTPDGRMLGAIVIARNTTEQHEREREQVELIRRERDARVASERASRELERLQVALDTALMRLSLDELLEKLLERATAALTADTATLLLKNTAEDVLTVRAARGLSRDITERVRVPIGKGFAGTIAATRRPRFLRDTKHADVVSPYLREKLHSALGVPLMVGERLIGVLHVGSIMPREFTASDVWLLQQIAERAALAIDRAQLYDALQVAHDQEAAQVRKLDAIIESMAEGVILYSPNGATLHANSAYRRMMGIGPESDQLNHDYFSRGYAVAPRDARGAPLPESQWPAARVLRGEVIDGEHSQDIWLRTYDGNEVLYSATGGPVYDDQGSFIGAVMALRDVTAHRRLEREATARAAELEAIIETMVDGLFVHDVDGAILRVNSSGRKHLGLSGEVSLAAEAPAPADRSALDVSQRLIFADSEGHTAVPADQWPVGRILRGESLTGAQTVEMAVRLPDGGERLLNISGAPMRHADGRLLGAVILTRDVTELHALERRTQESLEALLEMAEAVVTVTERSDQGAPIKAVGKRLIVLARRVLGCKRMSISAIDSETGVIRALAVTGLKPDEEAHWWAEQAAAEHRGVRLEDGPDQELVQRLRAGETVAINLQDARYSAVPNAYGISTMLVSPMRIAQQLVGIISLDYAGEQHDFTPDELNLASAVSKLAALVIERDHMLREQAAAEAQVMALAQANQRMDEFLGIAAHELRTPITVIKANLQMLLRRAIQLADRANAGERIIIDPQRANRDAELLNRTEKSLTRLTRLVDDLLDVSRVRAGKLEMRVEPAQLSDITRDAVEEQRLAMPDRVIELDLPEGLPTPIIADAERVGQVITNYLTNALKYSGATTPVRVRLWSDGRMAYVSVTDEGPGIPPDHVDQVWELFHRIPGIEVVSGSGIGLGLGLHLCRTLIERQGGTVGVTSEVGRGSTFWFGLPLLTGPER